MWGNALAVLMLSVGLASCWASGCCGVGWNSSKFVAKSCGALSAFVVILLVLAFMALTIFNFANRILA